MDTMDVDGISMSVIVEYPKEELDEISEVEDLMFTSATGRREWPSGI